MAQAARLNLRMQKELKLLLTDPPPGASFPLLSADSDLSAFSLSNILAQIEGPEDTVYAKGIFKIKIQIPDRYPFQPPIVTFATPIYHPNIDNGGRICLDILNLPPKGAWQPSLNISTVLTSIGLLLSEPNPDDGLMCEASKEYKYNRQAFDLKARSMTEKYARAEASENESGNQNTKSHSNLSMMETKGSELFKFEVDKSFESCEKLCPLSRKLSLESSGSNQKRGSDNKENEAPINHFLENLMEAKALKQQQTEMFKDYQHNGKLHGTRRKLSLESSGPTQKRNDDYKENVVPNQCSSVLNPQNVSMGSSKCLLVLQGSSHYEQHSHQQLPKDGDVKSINDSSNRRPKKLCSNAQENSLYSTDSDHLQTMLRPSPSKSHSQVSFRPLPMPMTTNPREKQPQKDSADRINSGFTGIKQKRLGLAGKKPSLGLSASSKSREKDNKENIAPVPSMLISNSWSGECYDGNAGNSDTNVASKKLCRISRKLPPEPLGKMKWSNVGNIRLHLDADNLKATPVKLLHLEKESRQDQKQLQDHDDRFAGQTKQQGEVSPTPESVIVLDSEDSDEERGGTLRSKLSLTRKRLLGKWNAKV